MDMTVPVLNTVFSWGSEMCFYLPKEHQYNPPRPINEKVYLSKKTMRVFATSVGGFPNKRYEARKLALKLSRWSQLNLSNIDFTFFMWMGFDAPWKRANRRTDILFMRKSKIYI